MAAPKCGGAQPPDLAGYSSLAHGIMEISCRMSTRHLEKVFFEATTCVPVTFSSPGSRQRQISPQPEAWAPPHFDIRIEVILERLFRSVPFIRCDGVRDRCQSFSKSISRNGGGCTLPISATYTPSQAQVPSENSVKPSKPCISPLKRSRRPHRHPRGAIKCKGTPGAVKGVHDLLTLAMYHSMKPIM